jgi:hypothetical protein
MRHLLGTPAWTASEGIAIMEGWIYPRDNLLAADSNQLLVA